MNPIKELSQAIVGLALIYAVLDKLTDEYNIPEAEDAMSRIETAIGDLKVAFDRVKEENETE